MNNFLQLITKRRSIRKYTDELLTPEQVETILKAGLMSPSSKGSNSWQLIAVEDKELLKKLSGAKKNGSKFIENSALSIIVIGDPFISDVWIEDASIISIMMQLQAEDLGLGSCWVQIRNRETENESSSEVYIKDIFDIPLQYQVLSIIAFGHKVEDRPSFNEEKLQWEKIHINKF